MQTQQARPHTSTSWMDRARVVAMALVVLDHVVFNVEPLVAQDTADARWWVAAPLLAVSRLAVPLFIMISGALLLEPGRGESLGTFARRRLQRVGLPLLVWSIAYLAFYRDVLDQPLTGDDALRRLVSGDPYYHLYYLYIALGLYAITPFLRHIIAAVDRRTVVVLCGLSFTFGVGNQMLQRLLDVGSNNGITYFIDFVGFYLLGWLLRDASRQERLARVAAPLAAVSLVLVVLVSWALIAVGQGQLWFYPHSYLSPFVIAASLGFYLLLRGRANAAPRSGVMRRLSDLTLGTYLVHPMVLDIVRRDREMPSGLDGFLWWVLVLTWLGVVAGMAITFVARFVPLLRKVF